jgi:hypothetical protein
MAKFHNIWKFLGFLMAGAVAGSLICGLAEAAMMGVGSARCFFGVTASSIVVAGVAGAVSGGFLFWRPKSRRQRILFVVAVMMWLPFIGILGDALVYQPIKFSYLTRRVELAQTPAEERAAFELAKRWGCCWEIHLESPPKTWLDSRQLDSVVRDSGRKLAVELEWLQSKPNGVPYRAYRSLIEKTNIYVLMNR